MFHNILQTSRYVQLFVFSQCNENALIRSEIPTVHKFTKKERKMKRTTQSCSEFKGNAYIFTTHGYCKFYKY